MIVQDFVDTNKITLTFTAADSNPHMPDFSGDHYKVVLRHNGHQMTLAYSKGYGHKGAPPTAAEVLECLASDAAGVLNSNGFEDWAADLGYDTDSRKAERIYKTCAKQAANLRRLLGDELAEQLIFGDNE